MTIITSLRLIAIIGFLSLISPPIEAQSCRAPLGVSRAEWPKTDFSRCALDIYELLPGGPRRDAIAAIDKPRFIAADKAGLAATTLLIALNLNGETRGYPLAVLIWHEIVNDVVGGIPVAVTYCPLCNAAIVFDRRHDGKILDFGTTGFLRHSDMVMYDRQSESWWQQYDGLGLIGQYSGQHLRSITSQLVGFADFTAAHGEAQVLRPPSPSQRVYGANPYIGYDSGFPMLFRGQVPAHIAPLARVVVAADKAWSFAYLAANTPLQYQGLTLQWQAGQASALDHKRVDAGRDVGSVSVTKNGQPIAHKVTFAFVVHAFEPERPIVHLAR